MAPSALSLGEIAQARFYGFCRSAGVCAVARHSQLASPPGAVLLLTLCFKRDLRSLPTLKAFMYYF